MMDFHAFQGDKATHVMTTHRTEVDETPLQLVSAAKVAHWQRVEAERDNLVARLNAEDEQKPLRKGKSETFLPGEGLPSE